LVLPHRPINRFNDRSSKRWNNAGLSDEAWEVSNDWGEVGECRPRRERRDRIKSVHAVFASFFLHRPTNLFVLLLTAYRFSGVDESFSSLGRIQILLWSNRDNPGRIDVIVRVVVMPFDVVEVDGLGNPGLLIKISQVTVQVRVIDDAPDVAFEMSVVNRIKPNKRYEQTPIGFQRLRSKKKSPSGESIVQLI